ncbi:MAG: metal ABC transporter solute-binding protein, Zn/Mn family [Chloroflexota bacterium]
MRVFTIPRQLFIPILLLITLSLAACGEQVGGGSDEGDDLSDRKIQVVATTGQVADAARNVGGDRVEVYGMMGPGVDPHLYRPTPEDTDALEDADIVFYNGLNLEGRMGDLLVRFASQKPTVPVAAAVPEDQLSEPPEFEGKYDPHVWFDPELWKHAIREIENELADLDPDNADGYTERADEYIAEIEELEEYAEQRLAEIPEESRVLVTAHDAFGYFGLRWGYEVRGLQGISTATEAGARDVRELAEFLVERDIKAVFVESSVSGATVEAVIEAANDRGGNVSVGGELYSDAMGDPGTEEGTYLGMYRHNVDTIVDSLQ